MSAAIIAGAMWSLSIVLLITARRRRSQRILVAASLIAAAQTLNVDDVYFAADAVMGSQNWMMLPANLLQVCGVAVLSTAIQGSVGAASSANRRWTYGLLALTACVMVGSFGCTSTTTTTGSFMREYGAQPAAAVFNGVEMAFIGGVLGHAGWVLVRFIPAVSDRMFALGIWLLILGSVSAVGFTSAAVVMDIAHVVGDVRTMDLGRRLYGSLMTASVLLLCGGFSVLPLARRSEGWRRSRRVNRLMAGVERVWKRVTPSDVQRRQEFDYWSSEMRLHRQVIEIEDALLASPGEHVLSRRESCLMRSAQVCLARLAQLELGR
ncbi:hypothetical protein [Plantibacter sp. MMLR14_011]|uniref:hypothetical protein n=1 Tax=Plantibacter sp. MMLR14_011 TaxID=1898746 RepID=UPI0008DD8D7B|nr:hypothetical protein [Plantibacter sp. MMLR14_011]OII39300.1 hypothetical protein BIU99_07920 [Plantibacter sp. MMLR14_011]